MIECLVVNHAAFWILTGLLIISESLGETKLVKANGILAFTVELLENLSRVIRSILFRR